MATNIVFERDAVHELLGRVAAVAGSTATAPIVGHVLLEHDTHGVRVTATDLDAWLTLIVPAEAKKFAPIALPAGELHRVIAALPSGATAELGWAKEDAAFVTIKSGRTRFKLPVMAANEFPETPRGADDHVSFTASAALLNAMLLRTRWAVGKEQARFYLSGVFLHVVSEHLACTATNGHILALCETSTPEGAAKMPGVIVPTDAVKTIGVLIADTDANIEVTVSQGHVRIELEDDDLSWCFTTRLIDGTFPDYAKIIPSREGRAEVDVQAAAILGALARVALLTNEAHTVKITGAKGLLTISSAGPDGREAEEEIDASWKGKPAEGVFGFNAQYLKSVLQGVACETVVLHLDTPEAAALVTPRGRDDTVALIMPVKV